MSHPDPAWMHLLLAAHVAAGASAFLFAPVALATAKGGRQHRRWGMVYLWSMGAVAATALPMALYRPILFLALVAVFSFYLPFSGYRVLHLKALAHGGNATALDWIAAMVTFAASACLAGFGLFRPALVQKMSAVAIVFGCIGMQAPLFQLWSFVRKPTDRLFWWYTHLGDFLASYIAAWTAFSVTTLVQLLHNGAWYVWLWPTIVGSPAIALTTVYYKRKFAPGAAALKATA